MQYGTYKRLKIWKRTKMSEYIPMTRLDDIPAVRLDDIPISIMDDIQMSMGPDALVNRVFILDAERRNVQ